MTDDEFDPTDRGRLLRLVDAARRARLVRQWLPPQEQSRPRWWRPALATVVAVVVLVLGVVQFSRSTPSVETAPALPAAQVLAPSTTAPSAAAQRIVVSVVGKVRRVGVVRLDTESRVADAIALAGGARPGVDLTKLNLARKLVDGEQIYVGISPPQTEGPVPPANGRAPEEAATDSASTAGTVNLNTASTEELDALPGVGEVTAKRIVEWRTAHRKFASVQDLQQVDGIGPSKFARLREHVSVQ